MLFCEVRESLTHFHFQLYVFLAHAVFVQQKVKPKTQFGTSQRGGKAQTWLLWISHSLCKCPNESYTTYNTENGHTVVRILWFIFVASFSSTKPTGTQFGTCQRWGEGSCLCVLNFAPHYTHHNESYATCNTANRTSNVKLEVPQLWRRTHTRPNQNPIWHMPKEGRRFKLQCFRVWASKCTSKQLVCNL